MFRLCGVLIAITCLAQTGFVGAYEVPKDYQPPAGVTGAFEIPNDYEPPSTTKPLARDCPGQIHNVIFMIGDGMGIAQAALGRLALGEGKDSRLHLDRIPVNGIQFTFPDSASGLVTDSAASATALACGVKTENGALGMTPDGRSWASVAELAHARGMAVGLAVTSHLTDATPAGFSSHIASRKELDTIAAQQARTGYEVMLGGGMEYFESELDYLKSEGYAIATTRDELNDAPAGPIVGVFAEGGLEFKDAEPSLAEMTTEALERLAADPDGFFLMVEGSQIDWAGHANDEQYMVDRVLGFDAAVSVALDFAEKRSDTLLVITADHETGGLSLPAASDPSEPNPEWGATKHTSVPVPVYAYGPGALEFMGTYDNTFTSAKLARALRLVEFPACLNAAGRPK